MPLVLWRYQPGLQACSASFAAGSSCDSKRQLWLQVSEASCSRVLRRHRPSSTAAVCQPSGAGMQLPTVHGADAAHQRCQRPAVQQHPAGRLCTTLSRSSTQCQRCLLRISSDHAVWYAGRWRTCRRRRGVLATRMGADSTSTRWPGSSVRPRRTCDQRWAAAMWRVTIKTRCCHYQDAMLSWDVSVVQNHLYAAASDMVTGPAVPVV